MIVDLRFDSGQYEEVLVQNIQTTRLAMGSVQWVQKAVLLGVK
jgi:hypothetical protein